MARKINYQQRAEQLSKRLAVKVFNGLDLEIDVRSKKDCPDTIEECGAKEAKRWSRDYCRIALRYDWDDSEPVNAYQNASFDQDQFEDDIRELLQKEFGPDAVIRDEFRPHSDIEIQRKGSESPKYLVER